MTSFHTDCYATNNCSSCHKTHHNRAYLQYKLRKHETHTEHLRSAFCHIWSTFMMVLSNQTSLKLRKEESTSMARNCPKPIHAR